MINAILMGAAMGLFKKQHAKPEPIDEEFFRKCDLEWEEKKIQMEIRRTKRYNYMLKHERMTLKMWLWMQCGINPFNREVRE